MGRLKIRDSSSLKIQRDPVTGKVQTALHFADCTDFCTPDSYVLSFEGITICEDYICGGEETCCLDDTPNGLTPTLTRLYSCCYGGSIGVWDFAMECNANQVLIRAGIRNEFCYDEGHAIAFYAKIALPCGNVIDNLSIGSCGGSLQSGVCEDPIYDGTLCAYGGTVTISLS